MKVLVKQCNWGGLVCFYDQNFNHKDYLWMLYDPDDNWVNEFHVDTDAMKDIFNGFY